MRDAVLDAIDLTGLDTPTTEWSVTGSDPFFRSPIPLAAGASAALVMLGDAINQLHVTRGGPAQRIRIDADHASLSLLAMWLLQVDGQPALAAMSDGPPPPIGQFETADGDMLHVQPGLPHHVSRLCEILACDPDPKRIAAALATRRGTTVEAALGRAGVPAVLVRDEARWLDHAQGRTMRNVPVVEIERIDDAPPVPLAAGPDPLSGLRVLDLTRVLAGPTCARTLGEYGADVLHVDSPNLLDLKSAQADTAHGKRMTWLDLNDPDQHGNLLDLAGSTDVFVQSYRAARLGRRGLGPRALARLRPGIVYVSVNCYGHHGPWREYAGYDGNAMAATGIAHLHGSEPTPGIAVAMNDYATAYWGAYGAITALRRRALEGGSWHVKVSLAQSAMWFLRLPRLANGADGRSATEVERTADHYLVSEDSPYGVLRQLPPALDLNQTPPRWQRGTPLPGTSEAVWLPR